MPRPGPNHKQLLQDEEVRRWFENVARGSPTTADVYLRRLGWFCILTKIGPNDLLTKNQKELYNILLDFVSAQEKRGKTGSYTQGTLKVVRSWLAHHGVKVDRPIKVRGAQDTPTLRDERVPTQEELRRIFLAASARNRVCAGLIAHSGLRLETLGNFVGNDGLRISDFPELRINGKKIKFEAIPTMVVVRPELSKTRNRYITFLGEEGCDYLKAYLQERLRAGTRLVPDSDLIAPKSWDKKFVRTINIGDGIRTAIRAAGFRWRPYVLRAYFDTQLLLAESKGKLAHDYRVFWMGHKGSMEARYTTNKGRLTKELTEDMREAYKRCESFLSTFPNKKQAQSQTDVARIMLLGMGYSEKELDDKDLEDVALLQELVRKKWQQGPPAPKKQKVVEMKELPAYLEANWRFVASAGNDKAILDPPQSGAA